MECYVEYFNKDKNHAVDKKEFKTYEDAEKWCRKNLDNYHPDMINYNN